MNWNHHLTQRLAEWLRFAVRLTLFCTAISGSAAFAYLTIKLCWFTVRWLDRVWFSSPW